MWGRREKPKNVNRSNAQLMEGGVSGHLGTAVPLPVEEEYRSAHVFVTVRHPSMEARNVWVNLEKHSFAIS